MANRRSRGSPSSVACLEPMLRRRQLLAASATTLPLFLAASACRRPEGLEAPPPLSADVRALFAAVTAEENLISLYARTIAAYSPLSPALEPLLAEHWAHLAQLRARIIEPPEATLPEKAPEKAKSKPPVPATRAAAVAALRAAEQAAVTGQLRRLAGASPSLAQLYASIAASEATHVTALQAGHAWRT